MKIVLQRVSGASVEIDGEIRGTIQRGLLLMLAIGPDDDENDARWLVSKVAGMRIFEDEDGKMNLSVSDVNGRILLISQFTLYASTRKGNRPSFSGSAGPEKAIPLYNFFHRCLEQETGKTVETGEFGAHMNISLCNDGPVTIIMDSRERL